MFKINCEANLHGLHLLHQFESVAKSLTDCSVALAL